MKLKKGDIVKYDVDPLTEELNSGLPPSHPLYTHKLRGVVLETSQAQQWRTMLWSPQVLIRWATIDEPEWVHAEAVCLV